MGAPEDNARETGAEGSCATTGLTEGRTLLVLGASQRRGDELTITGGMQACPRTLKGFLILEHSLDRARGCHTCPAPGKLLGWKGGRQGQVSTLSGANVMGGWEAGIGPGEEVLLEHSSRGSRIKMDQAEMRGNVLQAGGPAHAKARRPARQAEPDLPASPGLLRGLGSQGRVQGLFCPQPWW